MKLIYFLAPIMVACTPSTDVSSSASSNSEKLYDFLVADMVENYWRGRYSNVIESAEAASKITLNEHPSFEHHLFLTVKPLRDGEVKIVEERLDNFELIISILDGEKSCPSDDFAKKPLAEFSIPEFERDVCAEIFLEYYDTGTYLEPSYRNKFQYIVEDMRKSVVQIQSMKAGD